MNAKRTVIEAAPGLVVPPQLELLLVYEDVPSALRAKNAVEHVLSGLESRPYCHIHAWKLDVLRQPDVFGQAIHDALAADIVVLSTHHKNGLDLKPVNFLMQWAGLKRHAPGAVLISVHPDARPFTEVSPELTELCWAAKHRGMMVFFHAGEPPGSSAVAAPAQAPDYADLPPNVFAGVTEQFPVRPAPWGINE
jgi:hypothetical protein